MFAGIDVDGFVGATVEAEIRLAVTIEIEFSEADGSGDRRFENASFDEVIVPVDRAGQADLEGKDFCWHKSSKPLDEVLVLKIHREMQCG